VTNNDILETRPSEEARSHPLLGQILFYLGLCLSIGCTAVTIGISIEDGFELIPTLIVGAIVIAGIAMMFYAVRIGNFDAPSFGSKTGRAQLILLISAVLGGLVGFYLVVNGTMDRFFEGDFTISRIEAIVALIVLFVVILPLAVIRERNADELEQEAARVASYWSFSVYLYGYMAWSIAQAGGLVPALNHGYFFFFLLFLFLGIWAFKRSG
jgi:uncharacterized membrane protein